MDNNTKKEEIVLGTNSALIPEAYKNYVAKIYLAIDFFKIPFDLKTLSFIDGNIWLPSESDKEYMSQSAYDEALKEYEEKKSKLYFNNVHVNYESCDCGGGYACGHYDWPYEIEIKDKAKNVTHKIDIDGDDSLIFFYNKTEIMINGLKNFTYGDFIRFCKLCNITLESNYIM